MKTLHTSAYYDISIDGDLVRVKRTPAQFADTQAIAAETKKLKEVLHGREAKELTILADLRDGPMRNDPAFEQASKEMREFMTSFRRAAILLKTAVGKLQVTRLSRDLQPGNMRMFDDEAEALAFLKQ
jgi:hypothetical protein